jgi:hypothetical protein
LEREREISLLISEGEDLWGKKILLSTALILVDDFKKVSGEANHCEENYQNFNSPKGSLN